MALFVAPANLEFENSKPLLPFEKLLAVLPPHMVLSLISTFA
jgi:5'-3' exonuclease